jgi:uncharacterized protein (TIGR02266 family)
MTQDTRKDRRVKIVSLNVRYKSATVDEFIENHALDVSRGGIYIKTGNPFPPGTLLKFEIRLASDQAVIAGVGRVVWKRDAGTATAERPAGMGVKFIKIDEPSKSVIDKLVSARADAGRAFESEAEGPSTVEEPAPKVAAPAAAPAITSTAVMAPVVAIPAGASPPIAAKAPAAVPKSTMPLTPPPASGPRAGANKATMMGLGSLASAAAASERASGGASDAVAASTPRPTPSAPPRPRTAAMFPSAEDIEDLPAPGEQTVMKQAAELLEEALREAGGSMEEIGTNPLFSGTAAPPIEVKSAPPPPVHGREGSAPRPESRPPAAAKRGTPTPPPLEVKTPLVDVSMAMKAKEADDAAKARAMVAGMSPAPKRPSGHPLETTRDSLAAKESGGPALASTYHTATPKKSRGGLFIVAFVLVAAGVVGVMLYRDRLFGAGGEVSVTAPPSATPPTPQTATATTSAASPSSSPSSSAAATASSAPTAGSASAAASASTAPAASSATGRGPGATGPGTTSAATAATAAGGTAAPGATGASAAATAVATGTASQAAPAPTPTQATAVATAAPAPRATAAPAPKPKPKPADDNPY